jgi:predicted acetyltransferase
MAVRLVKLTPELEPALREMRADYEAAGEPYHAEVAREFDRFLKLFQAAEEGAVAKGFVPWTTYWLLRDDGVMLGGIRLRHRLSERLWQDGGHIGYDIRPSERGKGYATKMLALVLEKARERGMPWVLLTVDPSNVASIHVMEKNGAHKIGKASESGYYQYRIDL